MKQTLEPIVMKENKKQLDACPNASQCELYDDKKLCVSHYGECLGYRTMGRLFNFEGSQEMGGCILA